MIDHEKLEQERFFEAQRRAEDEVIAKVCLFIFVVLYLLASVFGAAGLLFGDSICTWIAVAAFTIGSVSGYCWIDRAARVRNGG